MYINISNTLNTLMLMLKIRKSEDNKFINLLKIDFQNRSLKSTNVEKKVLLMLFCIVLCNIISYNNPS